MGGGGSSAVQLYSLDGYGSSSISDCVISGYTYPYYVISGNHWFTDNDVSGCTHQVVAVGGDYLHYNTTWRSSWGLPVRPLNAIKITAATLTVEPGVEVELGNQVLRVGYHDNGTLMADGATFTGGSGYIYLYRGSLTLTGCDLVGGGGSSAVQLYSLDGYGSSSISDCVISGYTYPYYVISGNHWFTDNDVSGCTHQVVAVGGDYLHYNTTWRSSWGLPVRLLNAIKITAATLTVEPGVEVELGNQVLWVGYHDNGTLTADGATFTGASGYMTLYKGTATLSACRVATAQTGIYCSSGSCLAYDCWFLGQSSYAVNNAGPGVIDARWCYWGHPTGPSGDGPGEGTAIYGDVLYEPWLLGPPVQPEYTSGDQSDSSGTSDDPVNTSTGDFFRAETDLTAPTRGGLLAFTRYYNSDAGAAARSGPVRAVSGQLSNTANPVADPRVSHALSTEHDGESHQAGTMAVVGLGITLITISTLCFACWFFQREVPSSTHTVANARKDRRAPEFPSSARTRERARRRRRRSSLAVGRAGR